MFLSAQLYSQNTSDSLSNELPSSYTISNNSINDSINKIIASVDSISNDSSLINNVVAKTDSTIKSEEKDFLDNEVLYNAVDSLLFDLSTNEVYLYGDAYVKYGDITLTADRIIYDFDSYLVSAEGGVDSAGNPKNLPVFKQKKEEFKATKIKYNFQSEKGFISEVYSETNDAYVFAKQSKKQPNNNVHVKGGFFTTCSNPNPHYSFRTTKMIVIPDDKVVAGPGYVAVGNLPLPVGLPFIMFPNKSNQASGLVIPSYGDSREQGFFLRDGGFYWAMDDKFHTEILGTIYANGSWGVKNNSIYKKRYKFSGNFMVNYNDFVFGDRDINSPELSTNKSIAVKWTHRQDSKASKYSSFNSSVNFTNGSQYRDDISSSNSDYVNTNFNSNISYRYIVPNSPFSVSANARLNQKIDVTKDEETGNENRTTVNELTLPEVTVNMKRTDVPMAWIRKSQTGKKKWYEKVGLTYSLSAKNRLKYSPEQLDTISLDGDNYKQYLNLRNAIDHKANLSTSFKIKTLSISPFINGTANMYTEKVEKSLNEESLETETETIDEFSTVWGVRTGVNLTTKLYGMYAFKNEAAVKAMRHQITLSAGATYNPGNSTTEYGYIDEDGDFLSYSPYENAITTAPNSRPTNYYNFTIINDLEAKVRQKNDSTTTYNKVKFIDNLNATASFDAFKDSIRWTNVRISGRFTKVFNTININYNAIFDPYAYNSSGKKIGESYFSQTGKPIRLKTAGIVAQARFKSKTKTKKPKPKNEAEQRIIDFEKDQLEEGGESFFENLQIPWSFNINYNLNLAKEPLVFEEFGAFRDTIRFIQTLSLNGSFTLYEIFRFNVRTGYDFLDKSIQQHTNLGLYVDLHCWELSINVTPFGRRKSYSVSFNVKSSLLSDLKIKKQDSFGNAFF